MKNEKKFKGIYLDSKTNTYYVSTTFLTQDGFEVKKCKRGFKTQREANAWKEEQRVFYSKNCLSSSGAIKTPTETLLDRYLEQKNKTKKTNTMIRIKSQLYNHFLPFFKDKKIADLKPLDINEYYLYLADLKLKNQSKNAIIVEVLSFIEYLDLMELIPPTINRKFKLILQKFEETEECKNNFLEKDEINKLLDSFGITRNEKMFKLLFSAFIYSGLRHSEMLALTYADINYEDQTISVNKQLFEMDGKQVLQYSTKTGQNKIVDIPSFLIDMFIELQQIDEKTKKDKIFTLKSNKVVSKAMVKYTLAKHLDMVGLPHTKVHDLRHTYATILFSDGNFNDRYIAKQLGHSSPETSHKVYEHLTKNKNQQYKTKIDSLVN